MTRSVEGDVVRLRCSNCGSLTAHIIFSGENDVATAGLVSLSSTAKPEVVIAEAGSDELADLNDDYGRAVERRVSTELSRQDLRFVPLLRAELQTPAQPTSFQEFRSAYRPPKLIFACPHCAAGEATPEATMSFREFESEGGKLTTMGDFKLAP